MAKRVLTVDDSRTMREMVAFTLRQAGYEVQEAEHGQAAIAGDRLEIRRLQLQHDGMAAKAGGYHYRWVDGSWRDTRDASEFIAALNQQASRQAGKPLQF